MERDEAFFICADRLSGAGAGVGESEEARRGELRGREGNGVRQTGEKF